MHLSFFQGFQRLLPPEDLEHQGEEAELGAYWEDKEFEESLVIMSSWPAEEEPTCSFWIFFPLSCIACLLLNLGETFSM